MIPRQIAPQLLTPAKAAPEGAGWIHEVKYDGFRLLCRVEAGRARLLTRGGHDWTSRMRTVADAVDALGLRDGWLDGEAVVLGEGGIPSFAAVQRAMRGGRHGAALTYQVFDAPWLNGRDLTTRCVLERKARLEDAVRGRCAVGVVRFCDHLRGEGPALFARAFEAGLEGVVCKRVGSPYRPGERTREWLKVKCFHTLAFRVAGHTPGMGTLFLCAEDDGEGRRPYAGRVSGWARAAVRQELRDALWAARARSPAADGARPERGETVRWVEPAVRVEVAALAWKPGEKLRHATLRRVLGVE